MEQQSRLGCLIFSGSAVPQQLDGERTAEVFQAMIQDRMGITAESSDIKAAYRLQSKNILVEFTSIAFNSVRDRIFRSKTSKLQGSGLFVSESLTSRRQKIFQRLLQLKRSGVIVSVFTQSGDIFIRRHVDSVPQHIQD